MRVLLVVLLLAGCTATVEPPPLVEGTPLDCAGPIDHFASPKAPHEAVLDAVALDTTTTVDVGEGGDGPHRYFAKTGLLVHADHEAVLVVPDDWADRLSIAWGNRGSQWTTKLRVPKCPTSTGDQWLAYPGGYSISEPACVPLEIRAEGEVRTAHIALGVPCS